MNIVLTYDPRWKYTPNDRTPIWSSLDAVDFVAEILDDVGIVYSIIKADDSFEINLTRSKYEHPETIVFWLNDFTPDETGKDQITMSIIEMTQMMHTGPSCSALEIGLDKVRTKEIFIEFGMPTPDYYLIYPGKRSSIFQQINNHDYVMVKPLFQGASRGIWEDSVTKSDDQDQIRALATQIHEKFNEPAIVEGFIGVEKTKEFTIPLLVNNDGRIVELPCVEFDLSCIPYTQDKFKYLTYDIKSKGHFQKLPADIPPYLSKQVYHDAKKVVSKIGCKDLTRVDVRMDHSGLYYLEVNVFPDKSEFNNSLMMSVYSLGITFPEIIAFIPFQAMLKYGYKPPKELVAFTRPVVELFEKS